MKLLVDTCLAVQVVRALRDAGQQVDYVGDLPEDPGDAEILQMAVEGRRILVTRDKDFGIMAGLMGREHCGILQLRRLPMRKQAAACLAALLKHATDLHDGAIVTVQPGRIRVRRGPRAG